VSEPMTLNARVAAPLPDVYRALTDPSALRTWFCEHAEIDLPHRYSFWGRYTPDGDAPHQRVLHADDHTLRFKWLLDGEETTTEFSLTEEGAGATIVALSQSHFDMQEAMTGGSIRGVLQTFWALSIANLVDYLEGRALTPRCDFTSADLRAEFTISASVEKVYDSLIDSEKASAWFGYPIAIEPWVGGRFAMGGFESGFAAKIVELEPRRKMTIDWGNTGVSSWELEGSGGKTRMTFVQSGFDTQRPPYAAWMGTLSGFAELRRYHELRDWQPIWFTPEASAIAG
jgi:uncharacterized protein YndB with AHSA1/START domain